MKLRKSWTFQDKTFTHGRIEAFSEKCAVTLGFLLAFSYQVHNLISAGERLDIIHINGWFFCWPAKKTKKLVAKFNFFRRRHFSHFFLLFIVSDWVGREDIGFFCNSTRALTFLQFLIDDGVFSRPSILFYNILRELSLPQKNFLTDWQKPFNDVGFRITVKVSFCEVLENVF